MPYPWENLGLGAPREANFRSLGAPGKQFLGPWEESELERRAGGGRRRVQSEDDDDDQLKAWGTDDDILSE